MFSGQKEPLSSARDKFDSLLNFSNGFLDLNQQLVQGGHKSLKKSNRIAPILESSTDDRGDQRSKGIQATYIKSDKQHSHIISSNFTVHIPAKIEAAKKDSTGRFLDVDKLN